MPFLNSLRSTYGAQGRFTLDSRIGLSSSNPAPSATAIKSANPSAPDGFYWISAAWSNNTAKQVYCDMTTDGGGWMLFATKVSPSFNSFSFGQSVSDSSYSVTGLDTYGKVPSSSFTSLLWRFLDKSGKPYVTKYTKSEDTGANKTTWNNWIVTPVGNNSNQQVGGWRKSIDGGATFSSIYSMEQLYFHSGDGATVTNQLGISEQHGNPPGSDQYLDLWSAADGSNNYTFTDNVSVIGQKCIAGYCYANEPVLFMWR